MLHHRAPVAAPPGPATLLVLDARTGAGRPPDQAALEQTGALLRQRLAAIGLGAATVQVGDDGIVLSGPADRVADAQQVTARGE